MKTKSQLILEAYGAAAGYRFSVYEDKAHFFNGVAHLAVYPFPQPAVADLVTANIGFYGKSPAEVWDAMLSQLERVLGKTEDELMAVSGQNR